MLFQPVVVAVHLLDYFLMLCTFFFSAVKLIRPQLSNWSALCELISILPAPSDVQQLSTTVLI